MTGAGWTGRIAGLVGLSQDLRAELEACSRIVRLPVGATAFSPGQAADHLLLVLRGTVREVVSRQLQEFQRCGWIAQSRGAEKICDRRALTALGQG